ncbi:MAG: glutamine-hydrolyzing GMP synthase [Halobacteria archaeon]
MVDAKQFIDDAVSEIENQVGDGNAVMALSGGVDSSVCAALAYEAIGDRLTPVYVDTGLMRKGETDQIRETFSYMDSLVVREERDRFLDALQGVVDPEEKRQVIGREFIRVFEEVASDADADYCVQGTIYPDRVESKGNIKSHHNVGGLPEVIDFDGLVEPVRELYKDEVRDVAHELELPDEISERMPFPGPGLAVRIVGEVTEENLEVAREANAVVEREVEEYHPWQAFAAVLGKATGVKGDNRVHGWVVTVRAVESRDGMTAQALQLDWSTLQKIQASITGKLPNVSRVVYDVTHKPPATIEYE